MSLIHPGQVLSPGLFALSASSGHYQGPPYIVLLRIIP